jgi:hypothetical protein
MMSPEKFGSWSGRSPEEARLIGSAFIVIFLVEVFSLVLVAVAYSIS